MNLWNVRELRETLAGPGLSNLAQLGYLVVVLCLLAGAFVSVPQHNLWSLVYGILVVLLIISGCAYAYGCNGASKGRDFLPRFFSLAFVCGVRWILFLLLPGMAMALLLPDSSLRLTLPGELLPLRGFDVFVRLILVPPYFWLVGNQLRAVRLLEVEAQISVSPMAETIGLEPLED